MSQCCLKLIPRYLSYCWTVAQMLPQQLVSTGQRPVARCSNKQPKVAHFLGFFFTQSPIVWINQQHGNLYTHKSECELGLTVISLQIYEVFLFRNLAHLGMWQHLQWLTSSSPVSCSPIIVNLDWKLRTSYLFQVRFFILYVQNHNSPVITYSILN